MGWTGGGWDSASSRATLTLHKPGIHHVFISISKPRGILLAFGEEPLAGLADQKGRWPFSSRTGKEKPTKKNLSVEMKSLSEELFASAWALRAAHAAAGESVLAQKCKSSTQKSTQRSKGTEKVLLKHSTNVEGPFASDKNTCSGLFQAPRVQITYFKQLRSEKSTIERLDMNQVLGLSRPIRRFKGLFVQCGLWE